MANELRVTLIGNGITILFNDAATPDYLLKGTAELLSTLQTRSIKTPRQGMHGVDDSLSQDEDRGLVFDGEILGDSQSDCKDLEWNLRQCVALPTGQSYAGDDGYILAKFQDTDNQLFQCYVKLVSYPVFRVLDNADSTRRGFDFVMMAKDPNLYGQTLNEEDGTEQVEGTNLQIVEDTYFTIPFQLYELTIPSLTCTGAGIAGAPPIITVAGAADNPVILNQTSGKFMKFDANGGLTLAADDTLVINYNEGTIIVTDVDGVETNVSGNLSNDSEWILIEPGDNDIVLYDDSPGTLTATLNIQWRDVWK